MPKELLLLLAVIFFATVHARSEEKVPLLEGFRSVMASAGIAFMIGWNLFEHTPLLPAAVIGISSTVAFLGTSVQLAITKYGTSILSKPDQLLRAVLPAAIAKFFPPSDDSPSAKTPESNV